MGGLGIKGLEEFNFSLLSKWVWRFATEEEALWNKVIKGIYGDGGGFTVDHALKPKKSIWNQIIKALDECKLRGVDFRSMACRQIQNGKTTRFWHDNWLGDCGTFSNRFPRLFALENQKNCMVADRWVQISALWQPNWNWRSTPRGRAAGELTELWSLLKPIVLQAEKEDLWVWRIGSKGFFTVKNTYTHFFFCPNSRMLVNSNVSILHSWNSFIPIKINVLLWRALINKLPFKDNLLQKNVEVEDDSCVLCKLSAESDLHMFFECDKTKTVWRKIYAWWRIPFPQKLDWSIFSSSSVVGNKPKGFNKAFHGICCIVIWAFWCWRNKILFPTNQEGEKWEFDDVFPFIQKKSLLWLGSRCGHLSCNWDSWILNPWSPD